jgi:hypothetical protein
MPSDRPSAAHIWAPIIVVILGCLWSLHYVVETRARTTDEPDTFLFISFLIWPLGLAGAAVIFGVFREVRAKQPPPILDPDSIGLKEPRRILLAVSLPIYGAAIVFGGFLIPSVLYILTMVRLFGVKSMPILIGMAICVVAIVWLGFFYLLSVPLQLWPPGFEGAA